MAAEARMSHGREGVADEDNKKVKIGDKDAKKIMDGGSMDDTTVDGSNDEVMK